MAPDAAVSRIFALVSRGEATCVVEDFFEQLGWAFFGSRAFAG